MKIFTENNAFHNVGKCLDGTCMDVCQAGDALQMCVQVILYDKIEISPFVPREVNNKTQEIKGILERNYGLQDVFDVRYPPSQETEVTRDLVINLVKQTVNNNIKNYLDDCEDFYVNYSNYHDNPLSLLPELGDKKDRVEYMTELIQNRNKGPFIEAMVSVPRTEDGGITEIICQTGTRNAIFEFAKTKAWGLRESSYLIARIQYLLNEKFAGTLDNTTYSPSMIRGRINQPEHEYLIQLERVVRELREYGQIPYDKNKFDRYFGGIAMPSIARYLICESQGRFSRMCQKAVELRQLLKPLRQMASKKTTWLKFYQELLDELLRHNGGATASSPKVTIGTSGVNIEVTLEAIRTMLEAIIKKFTGKNPDKKLLATLSSIALYRTNPNEFDTATETFLRNCGITDTVAGD